MAAARPGDALEAMLAAQMAAVHGAAMRALKRTAECTEYPQIEALYTRQAARLMTLHLRQAEALERRQARREAREAEVEAGEAAEAATATRPNAVNGARKPAVHAGPPGARRKGALRAAEAKGEGARNGHRRNGAAHPAAGP